MSIEINQEEKKQEHVSLVLVKRSSRNQFDNSLKKKEFADSSDSQQSDKNLIRRHSEVEQVNETFEEQLLKLKDSSSLDIVKFNNLVERYLKRDQIQEVIKRLPIQLNQLSTDKPEIYDAIMKLKPNIFTYSMLFKVMQSEIKKFKHTQHPEDHNINEANQYWFDLIRKGEEFTPNIIVLNQYIQIYLASNQNSNALQLYKEYLNKLKLIPDRITLVNLERISYKLTQNLINLSKKQTVNNYELQRIVSQTNQINQIFLQQKTFEDIDEYREKFENLFKYLIEVSISRYDLYGVLNISQIIFQKFKINRIGFMKQAFTYFYQNILSNQGQVSKILNVYAEQEGKSIQDFLLSFSYKMIDELVNQENLNADGQNEEESSLIQVTRIYMEQLQILFRYNSIQGIISLFHRQLMSIPAIYYGKLKDTQLKVPFPDIHSICLIVKCLIRDKCPNQALNVTQFLKENCVSNEKVEGQQPNLMELPNNKEPTPIILQAIQQVVEFIVFDINTFFLNGIVIELNSRRLYLHAIALYKWMERNSAMNHRPNTSTYNMIILVYGSMEDYISARQIFQRMYDCWKMLNSNEEFFLRFDEVFTQYNAPRIKTKSTSSGSLYLSQQLCTSQNIAECDEDQPLGKNNMSQKDVLAQQSSDIQQFKHASDTLQKHLSLKYPPANVNSYISLVNTLNRQKLYEDIIRLLRLAEDSVNISRHQILREDMNDLSPLFQSIVKNFLQSRSDEIKIQACKIAIESLRKKFSFQDSQLYYDCLDYLKNDAPKRKKMEIQRLEDELSLLVQSNKSRESQKKTSIVLTGSNKKIQNEQYIKQNLSRSAQFEQSRRKDSTDTSGSLGDTEISSQKSIGDTTKPYKFKNSKSFLKSTNLIPNKMHLSQKIEEMLEEDSPQFKPSLDIKEDCIISQDSPKQINITLQTG